jgi:preprotein translocase subunit YajC
LRRRLTASTQKAEPGNLHQELNTNGRKRTPKEEGRDHNEMMAAILLQTSGGSGFGGMLIPLGLMFAIMYFMVIMPQQRQRKKVQAMLAELKAGDKVITNGGIYGTVNGIDGDSVILKISSEPQVKIRITRAAIAQVEASEDAK